jgi:hypothetical protein
MASFALSLLLLWALAELASLAGARLLYRWTRIYWSPRDAPRLGPLARDFTTQLVEHAGQGELKCFSPTLGWTHAPGASSRDGLAHINQAGARADHEVESQPAPGKLRIATHGDCLVFGGGVPLESTWQARLETLDSRLEVLNFGVEGYGPDQMLLRYRETREACSGQRIVILGLAATNVFKCLNAYRPFYAYDYGLQLAKPRFRLGADGLETLPSPMSSLADYQALLREPEKVLEELGREDAYFQRTYRSGPLSFLPSARLLRMLTAELSKRREVRDRRGRLRPGSEALRTTLAILSAFRADVLEDGATPLVMLMPLRADVVRHRRHGVRPWDTITAHLDEIGCPWLDVLDALGAEAHPPLASLFVGRHYSPAAHELIAAQVQRAIASSLPQAQLGPDTSSRLHASSDRRALMAAR